MQESSCNTISFPNDLINNPRKATTHLKSVNDNLWAVKRRLKVLSGQDDYNRYKTVDQERKIVQHHSLH